jgi:hypothetical protein
LDSRIEQQSQKLSCLLPVFYDARLPICSETARLGAACWLPAVCKSPCPCHCIELKGKSKPMENLGRAPDELKSGPPPQLIRETDRNHNGWTGRRVWEGNEEAPTERRSGESRRRRRRHGEEIVILDQRTVLCVASNGLMGYFHLVPW